jgi:hypothetical protein
MKFKRTETAAYEIRVHEIQDDLIALLLDAVKAGP